MSCGCGALRAVLSLFACILACQFEAAGAQQLLQTEQSQNTSGENRSCDELATQILDRELEWQKINQELYLEAVQPSFARGRRQWIYDIGNAVPTEAGLIAAVVVFYHNSNDKMVTTFKTKKDEHGRLEIGPEASRKGNHLRGSEVAAVIIPQIAGQAVGVVGGSIELVCDAFRRHNLRRRRLDRKAVTARIGALKNEIDLLLTEYLSRVATSPMPESYRTEARLLQDIRDRALVQFADFEWRGAAQSAVRTSENTVGLMRNVVGSIGNSINVGGL
ncbi:MAG TPA: hypothetical protein V6C72_19600, partial [Chroococcales cyanobacterium]